MDVLISSAASGSSSVEEPHVYALGLFDGVHIGHRAVIESARAYARQLGIRSGVITFDRHPASVLEPRAVPPYISTLTQKMTLFELLGVDTVVVLRFDEATASMEPLDFVNTVLLGRLRMSAAVVGHDYAFGRGGSGTTAMLQDLGNRLGFGVKVISPVAIGDRRVSSTLIRDLLRLGDMETVASYLGRPYSIAGSVVRGRRLGRTIGFPTVNLTVPEGQAVPRFGVYTVVIQIAGITMPGVCNIGVKPTVGGSTTGVETHIIGFEGDTYDQMAEVQFLHFIRDERRFGSLSELRDSVASDLATAVEWFDRNPSGLDVAPIAKIASNVYNRGQL